MDEIAPALRSALARAMRTLVVGCVVIAALALLGLS